MLPLCLLLLAARAPECDRLLAREARKNIRDLFLKPARKAGLEPSRECPFAPENDKLLPHEDSKAASRKTARMWRCTVCQKHFRTEAFLDKHLQRKHAEMMHSHRHAECLADHCETARCPSWQATERARHKAAIEPCRPRELEARRRACSSLVLQCFGAHGRKSKDLVSALNASLCEPIACDWRDKCYGEKLGPGEPLPAGCEAPSGKRKAATWITFTVLAVVAVGIIAIAIAIVFGCLDEPDPEPRRHPVPAERYRADAVGGAAIARSSATCRSRRGGADAPSYRDAPAVSAPRRRADDGYEYDSCDDIANSPARGHEWALKHPAPQEPRPAHRTPAAPPAAPPPTVSPPRTPPAAGKTWLDPDEVRASALLPDL